MEEGRFNIELKKLKIFYNNNSEKKLKSSNLGYGREDIVEIDSILLLKSLRDYHGFELGTSDISALFKVEDPAS